MGSVMLFYYLRNYLLPRGGGPLVFQGGYHPRKKNHVIRVVFQDQTMYARTSFRVSKHAKLKKKKGMKILHKYVFRVCYKNLLKSYVKHVFLMILSILVAK